MDYIEIMQSFEKVLRRSPLNTTHWHIESDRFVRMGEAVVNGYLNLNILRSLKSKDYVKGLAKEELQQIYNSKPISAAVNAYSLETSSYLSLTSKGNRLVANNGHKSLVSNPKDMERVIFFNDVICCLFKPGITKVN